jgi:hypothetical protein
MNTTTTTTSRRAMLAGLAATPALAVPAIAAPAIQIAHSELTALCGDFVTTLCAFGPAQHRVDAGDLAIDRALLEQLHSRLDELEDAIVDFPGQTMADLQMKALISGTNARSARYITEFTERVERSIARDLMRLFEAS